MGRQQFEPSSLTDPAWRARYADLLSGWRRVGREVAAAYGLKNRALLVQFDGQLHANASARLEGERYVIEIASVLPYLVHLLFQHLLSDPENMPWLPSDDTAATVEDMLFVLAPSKISETTMASGSLTPDRHFAAKLLADIVIDFVFFHEIGHVLSGHFDADRAQGGTAKIAELHLVKRHSKAKTVDLSQVWEIDADVIGVGFLQGRLDRMIADAMAADQDSQLHRVIGPNKIVAAQVISFATVALYCFFRYLGETRLQLDLSSDHPDPLARVFYLRNAIVPAMRGKVEIDDALFDDVFTARFEEFDDALELLGIHSAVTMDDDGLERVNDLVEQLLSTRRKLRHVAEPYSFVPWPDDAAT